MSDRLTGVPTRTRFVFHYDGLQLLVSILTRLIVVTKSIHEVFLKDWSHSVNVLDHHHSQPLAVHVVVAVVTEGSRHLTTGLVLHKQMRARRVVAHKCPDVWNVNHV